MTISAHLISLRRSPEHHCQRDHVPLNYTRIIWWSQKNITASAKLDISLPKAKVSIQSFSWWSIRRSWQIIPQANVLGACSVSPGMFLLIHSWTDGSFSMQILLSAFSSRPRCSFTPNKACALFFVHAVARVHFLDLEPFYASDLDLWSAKTRVSIKHPLSLKEYAYF